MLNSEKKNVWHLSIDLISVSALIHAHLKPAIYQQFEITSSLRPAKMFITKYVMKMVQEEAR